MVFALVLLLVVFIISGRLLVQHFTRQRGAEPLATCPIVTATETSPEVTQQAGAIARSSSEAVAEADERKRRATSRNASRIVPAYLDERLPRIDLRELPSSRFRIVGTAYWLRDDERARYGGQEYELVREPENEHDENAVAVYGRGRKVGHLSAAKAAALASDLDRLGPASFVVSGDTVSQASIKMWVDIPRVPALRTFKRN
ncbi:HIRAN domain-containing protein [Curtobacterium sp. MCPF17_021]|uniref:HIRAN domain-containing protein n=1 Tax=Curtobacterium sp. MCPF17_021 TaxID=2175639 RepID=UPI000DA71930|nr:HIRAN domain-containing protein [Curtobacterium sp. MCPF17_021]WIE83465.1 HIRAN domain-containing protein [Curtobacterium sp. MCPF17_021]